MKLIKVEDSVGQVLCHDMTQIIPKVTKDARFRKGYVVTKEDIPILLSMGKENIYIWENQEGMLHENEAAEILCEICMGSGFKKSEVKEGKIELIANVNGMLEVDSQSLNEINSLGEMMIASRHGNFPVKAGDKCVATRVIPLVIEEEKMKIAKKIAKGRPLFNILPYKKKKIGVVTTGSEVYEGRISDKFTPVIGKKLEEYDNCIDEHIICNDDSEMIENSIEKFLASGCDLIICTGGMSVDPDDRTPLAIKNTSDEIITYGAPVIPGAMLMLAYTNNGKAIVGLPGCVMYSKKTIFDLVLPRLICDVRIESRDLSKLGEGGLCLSCDTCTYPNCGFGK
ncbi:MAG: molybdopterin-binding protein [Clostridioides sp.]|jgi:molybdenum cofactor synthesis domain-containing protein|nr:molybdopterin-binding protein [Clostridioides sp.]